MYGIGHGGIEALLICGYSMLSLFIFSLQLNASGTEALLALGGDNAANVQQTIDAVTKNSWGMFLLSGVERIIAVCLHISLSVFVFLSARRSGKWYLYPVAILIHAVVDCTALFFNVSGLISNMWVLELIVAAMTAVVAYFAFRLYRRDAVISRKENADAAAAQVQDGEMSDR